MNSCLCSTAERHPGCPKHAAIPAVRLEPLLAAALTVREYLESPACAVKGFDVPDEIWVPFCQAIDAANAWLDRPDGAKETP